MSAENKALFNQFIDGMNAKDISIIDRLISPNFVDHDPMPGQDPGIEGMRGLMQMFFSAFPDIKVTTHHLVAE